jgi:hypothetical protein
MKSLWDNPIFVRSRQVENRLLGSGARAWLVRYRAPCLIVLGPLLLYLLFGLDAVRRNPWSWLHDVLPAILGFSAFLFILYVSMRALNGTFSAICLEREQKTYDSLLATLLTPDDVLAGKLAAGLWPVVRETLAVAPLGLGLGLLAGVAGQALLILGLCLSCALFFGLIGLWASFTSPTTPLANRKGTGLVAFCLVGGPVLDWMGYLLAAPCRLGGPEFVPVLTVLCPLAAATSIGRGSLTWLATLTVYAAGCAFLWGLLRRLAQRG